MKNFRLVCLPVYVPSLSKGIETVNHLFLYCDFAAKGWSSLLNASWVASCPPKKIDEWIMDVV